MGQLDKVFGVGGVIIIIIIICDMSPISPHVGPFHLSVFFVMIWLYVECIVYLYISKEF